jgi:hypothetical protein
MAKLEFMKIEDYLKEIKIYTYGIVTASST